MKTLKHKYGNWRFTHFKINIIIKLSRMSFIWFKLILSAWLLPLGCRLLPTHIFYHTFRCIFVRLVIGPMCGYVGLRHFMYYLRLHLAITFLSEKKECRFESKNFPKRDAQLKRNLAAHLVIPSVTSHTT